MRLDLICADDKNGLRVTSLRIACNIRVVTLFGAPVAFLGDIDPKAMRYINICGDISMRLASVLVKNNNLCSDSLRGCWFSTLRIIAVLKTSDQ